MMVSNTCWLKSSLLSSAHLRGAKLAQLGEDVAPNRWTTILYFTIHWLKSPLGHHRNLNKSASSSGTRTWWNMASISDIRTIGYFLNLVKTPTSMLVRSGPCRRCALSEASLNDAPNQKRHASSFFEDGIPHDEGYTKSCHHYAPNLFLALSLQIHLL